MVQLPYSAEDIFVNLIGVAPSKKLKNKKLQSGAKSSLAISDKKLVRTLTLSNSSHSYQAFSHQQRRYLRSCIQERISAASSSPLRKTSSHNRLATVDTND
ncbi:uncharacterized protein DS421_3g104130 [Arachis hypogaea]|nr:uncharacterized protein DS421_3g104130 [Arachis hypogaea]